MRANLIHAALLVIVGGTTANADFDWLKIDRARHEAIVLVLEPGEAERELIDGTYERYVASFEKIAESRAELNAWNQGLDLSHFGHGYDPVHGTLVAEDGQRIDRISEQFVRDLGVWYFDRLLEHFPEQSSSIESQRRAHLRDRVIGAKTPWRGQPVGVNVDLIALADRTIPVSHRNGELSALLHRYEIELDPLLRRLDIAVRTYRDEIRLAFDQARNARDMASPDLPRLLDRIVATLVRRHEPYSAIRTLNVRTAAQLTAMLPPDLAEGFRSASEQPLNSYMFDHEWSADARFRAASMRRELTDEQAEGIRSLRASHQALRRAEILRLSALYDKTISVQHYRRDFQRFVHRWATRENVPEQSSEELEFEKALDTWRARERDFCRQIAAIIGQTVGAEELLDLIAIDRHIPDVPDSLMQAYEDTFRPDTGMKEFEMFLFAMPLHSPDQEQSLRRTYTEMKIAFESRASEIRSAIRLIHNRSTAYEILHPESIGSPPHERAEMGWEKLWTDWIHEREQIQLTFEASIRSQLPDDQRRIWDKTMRDVRRGHEIAKALRHNGHLRFIMDLTAILRKSEISTDDQKVADALETYEFEIDQRLREYQDRVNASLRLHDSFEESRGTDAEEPARRAWADANQTMWNTMVEIHAATQRHILNIAGSLDEQPSRRFLDAADQTAYSQLFIPDPVKLATDAILQVDILGAERFEAILRIAAQYEASDALLRRNVIQATRQWEDPRQVQQRNELHQQLIEAGEDPATARWGHPATAALTARRNQAMQACRQIRRLVSQAEFDQLPSHVRLLLSWW